MTSYSAPPMTPGGSGYVRPHRGTAVLVLGILSLVLGCIGIVPGIIAIAMDGSDLREMDAGRMDPTGRGMTQAGRICGMVGVGLPLLGVLIALFWVFVMGGLAAAGAAGAR